MKRGPDLENICISCGCLTIDHCHLLFHFPKGYNLFSYEETMPAFPFFWMRFSGWGTWTLSNMPWTSRAWLSRAWTVLVAWRIGRAASIAFRSQAGWPKKVQLGGGNSNIVYFHPRILAEMIQFDWCIFQMGWKYQLVDDNKFSSWHVKLNIPMYKCIYNTIALLQYFEASQIGVLKFPSLNGVTDMSWSLWLSRGSGVDVFLLSMKAGGNLAQSHQGKNPREGPSFEIPMLTQKNVLDHHVLMRCLCNTTARSIQVTFK